MKNLILLISLFLLFSCKEEYGKIINKTPINCGECLYQYVRNDSLFSFEDDCDDFEINNLYKQQKEYLKSVKILYTYQGIAVDSICYINVITSYSYVKEGFEKSSFGAGCSSTTEDFNCSKTDTTVFVDVIKIDGKYYYDTLCNLK